MNTEYYDDDDYTDQLPADLLAQIEEQRMREAEAEALPVTEDDRDPDAEVLEAIAGEENHGRASGSGAFSTDGDELRDYGRDMTLGGRGTPKRPLRHLDADSDVSRLQHGEDVMGWLTVRLPSDRDPWRPTTELTAEEVETVLQALGTSTEEVRAVLGRKSRAPLTGEEAETRARLATIFAGVSAEAWRRGFSKALVQHCGIHRHPLNRLREEGRAQ